MLDLKIDKSQDPLSADIRLKVEKRNFDWSSSFKSGDKHSVKGFPLTIKGLKDADMFLTLTMARTARGIAYEAGFTDVLDPYFNSPLKFVVYLL